MSCNSVAVSPLVFVFLAGFEQDFLAQIRLSRRLGTVWDGIGQALDLTVRTALTDLLLHTIVAGISFAICKVRYRFFIFIYKTNYYKTDIKIGIWSFF